MAVLVWFTLGVALWHFTVFVPDRFWGGIVGAFLAAVVGAIVSGALWQLAIGDSIGQTDVLTLLAAVPGCLARAGDRLRDRARAPRSTAQPLGRPPGLAIAAAETARAAASRARFHPPSLQASTSVSSEPAQPHLRRRALRLRRGAALSPTSSSSPSRWRSRWSAAATGRPAGRAPFLEAAIDPRPGASSTGSATRSAAIRAAIAARRADHRPRRLRRRRHVLDGDPGRRAAPRRRRVRLADPRPPRPTATG